MFWKDKQLIHPLRCLATRFIKSSRMDANHVERSDMLLFNFWKSCSKSFSLQETCKGRLLKQELRVAKIYLEVAGYFMHMISLMQTLKAKTKPYK